MALTDQANMFGLVKFYKGCLDAGGGKNPFWAPTCGWKTRMMSPSLSAFTALCLNSDGYLGLRELISQALRRKPALR